MADEASAAAAAPASWLAGSVVEVGWAIAANHGGGYSYRLCPLGATALDEECFNRWPLQMVGRSALRWGGEGGRTLRYDAVTVSEGTKAGVMWRKNPVPMCNCDVGYDCGSWADKDADMLTP